MRKRKPRDTRRPIVFDGTDADFDRFVERYFEKHVGWCWAEVETAPGVYEWRSVMTGPVDPEAPRRYYEAMRDYSTRELIDLANSLYGWNDVRTFLGSPSDTCSEARRHLEARLRQKLPN